MSEGAQGGLGHPSAGPELWLRPSPDTTSQPGRERQILGRNSRQSLLYLCKPELSGLQGQTTETSLLPGNWRQGRERRRPERNEKQSRSWETRLWSPDTGSRPTGTL